MTSTKPYLLRAIHQWAEDNNLTPQVLVNAQAPEVNVPLSHVVDGQIVLNVRSSAVQMHVMDNECLNFSARFSGVSYDIYLPMDSILAIFARENSQGIYFEEADIGVKDPDISEATKPKIIKHEPKKNGSDPKKSSKSHLKIIK